MTLDPGFVQALEDRIVNAVVTRITRELDKREKVLFDKIDSMFTAISEQTQKKRMSIVDFQLGGNVNQPVGITMRELSKLLIKNRTCLFNTFKIRIGVEADQITFERTDPVEYKEIEGGDMVQRFLFVATDAHMDKVIKLIDHKDKTILTPLRDLQHFTDWLKTDQPLTSRYMTSEQEVDSVAVKDGFKITDMRGSPVVVRTEVHAENMQSLIDKGDTETTSDLSGNTTPVPTSSLQVDMTSVKEPIGYSMLDLSDDLKDFNICYQFHNFDLIMNEYGSTTLVVKDGEIDIQSVKQLLDNYISVNAIHTEPSVNSWMIDIRFLSIRKENKPYSLTGFKDFINLLMLDIKATTLAPEPQKPMTLLDLFSVQKRKELDNTGTFFNMFAISFNKRNSEFILTKNNNVCIRAVDVIRCFNNSIESIKEIDNFHHPVVLEIKEGETPKFIPLISMRQMAEWLLIKSDLTSQQQSNQSQELDKQQAAPPAGTFPAAVYGVNGTLTVR